MTHASEAITWHTELRQEIINKAIELLGTYVTATAWDDETTYALYDKVSFGGVIYTSLRNANLNKSPDSESSWWEATDLYDYTWGQVVQFPGTSADALFQFIPQLTLPAAVVIYRGTDFGNQPRQNVGLGVLVVVEAFQDDDTQTANAYADQVVRQLDRQVYNEALFLVQDDAPIDLGPGVAAILLTVNVEDH